MKRFLTLTFILALSAAPFAQTLEAARVVVRGPRARVTVRTGFPIRRTLPHVVVRPARVTVRVAPAVYLAPVVWGAVVVASPPPASALVWEDSESLDRDDDWTDFTLNVDARGQALFLDVKGRAQIQFAEVVFENGNAQVVDFDERVVKNGLYQLLDFRDGRKVDHVRMVARAKSNEAKIIVRMEK